ncbi:hypothetical protein COCC4DRAFT_76101 [Bipolaris maydis ATCC 48331]|uniref:DRBM domain-containing protein n=2 Tax=Cochliobolus heterostrophus TaxID=5016 RepID=M2SJM6_COCH5|nr:uncharacterized protein COCC4DRAFT_76101 [Bipolaris maydis ATCC 48331]EMD85535.1 hypothetical protein COCHEDRAFT_33389 [Bipolaris maydis C5]ENI00011.1 hypothetical protein COCC4DRAFT_76101 [Bipolaris maydis ATCC 48331]KAJ5021220.1 hypothetical protein J3E73DRAFT_435073 [Bipolaris maydis]KAJ6265952.1 hypothetical protein PSV08DRAFT_412985 [Bipolaris maydis]
MEVRVSVTFEPEVEYESITTRGSTGKAEESNMEIDTPTRLPVFNSAHTEQDPMARAAPPTGILSMEDFMKQNQDEYQAQREARYSTVSPPAKKATTSENASPFTLVAVGARSSKHTILLHEKYQALGIQQPLFTYEGSSSSSWAASVSFPGLENVEELQGLSGDKRCNSKQEAKEALSEKALAVLEEMERQGRVKKAEKNRKKSVGGQLEQQQRLTEREPVENYIGKLLEYQRSTSGPQPTYTDYQSGTHFACLLTLEGHPHPFGTLTSLFSSKKAARQDAARHAVEHFKALGTWPQDTPIGGIKKKKQPKPASPPFSVLSPVQPPNPNQSPTPLGSGTSSFAQRVATLAATLALPTPEWKYTAHPSDPTFHSVACFFRDAGPHEGPIGEVRNVFGKKRAKEECARLTLDYLLDVREKRRAYGARMMAGVRGGEGVVGAVEGPRVESVEGSEDEFVDAEEGSLI